MCKPHKDERTGKHEGISRTGGGNARREAASATDLGYIADDLAAAHEDDCLYHDCTFMCPELG